MSTPHQRQRKEILCKSTSSWNAADSSVPAHLLAQVQSLSAPHLLFLCLAKEKEDAPLTVEVASSNEKRKTTKPFSLIVYGAGDEARTRYLHLGKVALYQMSYARVSLTKQIIPHKFQFVKTFFKFFIKE